MFTSKSLTVLAIVAEPFETSDSYINFVNILISIIHLIRNLPLNLTNPTDNS